MEPSGRLRGVEESEREAIPADDAADEPAPPRESSPLPPQFLARLAHDIRSPLGLLSGALEEIREDLSDQLGASHTRMLSLAERGLARLERMARTLTTAAELSRESVRVDMHERDLRTLLDQIVQHVEVMDPRRNIVVTLDVPDGIHLALDGVRFEEAIGELLGQARRQARAEVRIGVDERDDEVRIRIEDDGEGWRKEQREHAFERLYEPGDRRGIGLGLSVARDLVRLHGGEVSIADSTLTPGRPGTLGGSFVVTLPRPED